MTKDFLERIGAFKEKNAEKCEEKKQKNVETVSKNPLTKIIKAHCRRSCLLICTDVTHGHHLHRNLCL